MEVLDDLLPVGSIDLRTRAKPLSPLTSPVTPALADWLPFPPGIVPQDPTGPITTTNWLPFTPDIIPYDSTDPTIKTAGDLILALAQLTKTNHIRATCQRLTQLHDPAAYVWYRVRVYIVPEHVRRRRNIGATQKADKLLPLIYQRYLDTRKSVFEGGDTEPVEVPVCLLPPEEPMKLVDLYLGMPSPAPDPESIRAHPQALPDTLRLLDECLSRPAPRGMTTTLYQYQKNTLWKLLQRELLPERALSPSLIPLRTVYGRRFYMDVVTHLAHIEPDYYDDLPGGIICEDMGTGKTCICLALILATKYQFGLPSLKLCTAITSDLDPSFGSYQLDPFPVPSLRRLAAHTVLTELVQYARYRDLMPEGLVRYLDQNRAYYLVHPQRRKGSRTREERKPMKVYLSTATLVVVPDSLVDQWIGEVYRHTKDLALKFFIITKRDLVIPPVSELLEYDMVLISHGRFGVENDKGGFEFKGIPRKCECGYIGATRTRDCHCRPNTDETRYLSPLLHVHWKRLIVDEGHTMSSERTRQVLFSTRLNVSCRWVCTGTPTSNLTDTVTRVHQDEDRRDLEGVGKILRTFLQLSPFSDNRDNWSRLVLRPFLDGHYGATGILRSTMRRTMVRTQRKDIERDIVLPPLHERVVILGLTRWQYLTHNCIVAFVAVNAVLSERIGEDYFFHRANAKNLKRVVANLWQSLFWYSSVKEESIVELAAFALANSTEALRERGKYSPHDVELLGRSKRVLEAALADPVWRVLMTTHQVGYFVDGLPRGLQERWALVNGRVVEGRGEEEERMMRIEDAEAWEEPLVCVMSARDIAAIMEMIDEVEDDEMAVDLSKYDKIVAAAWKGVVKGKKRKGVKDKNVIEGQSNYAYKNGNSVHKEDGKVKRKDKGKARADNITSTPSSLKKIALPIVIDLTTNTQVSLRNRISHHGTSASDPMILSDDDDDRASSYITSTLPPVPGPVPTASVYTRRYFSHTSLLSTTSSKLDYLVEQVRTHTANGEKCVVFSQWWNEMQSIMETLVLARVRCLLYTTLMSTQERSRNITTFNTSEAYSVIVMDIKLAAYGINLSTATRVYFVSPVWQTAVERQAIKRAHRIGQTKPVYVETLVIGGSMEEEILKRRSELGEEKSTATPTDDGKMKQILSAAEFVPSPPGMPDLAMEQSPVSYTSAERSASARASIPRIGDPIPFLKPKRQAVRQADVEADEGAGPSRRRIRFAETDEDTDEERDTDGEKDTGDGASRSSGLVDYVSSDDEEQANGEMEEDGSSSVITMSMKRKREEAEVEEEMKPKKGLPPLPDAFLELYPDKNRKSDNPSVHQGRVRATPHVPGNWATHVYIEVTVNSDFRDLLAKIVTTAQGPSSNGADAVIHPVLDDSNGDGDGTRSDASSQSVKLHVSLSRCVFLKVFQLDRFAELLTKALDGRKSFGLSFARITHFTNEDWTRSFMGLEVGAGYNELLGCLAAVDDVVSKFGHSKYYNPPRFHVSVAWSLTLPPLLEGLARVAGVGFERELGRHRVHVDRVWCKMGNRVVGVELT